MDFQQLHSFLFQNNSRHGQNTSLRFHQTALPRHYLTEKTYNHSQLFPFLYLLPVPPSAHTHTSQQYLDCPQH